MSPSTSGITIQFVMSQSPFRKMIIMMQKALGLWNNLNLTCRQGKDAFFLSVLRTILLPINFYEIFVIDVGTQNNSKLKELSLPLVSTSDCRKSWPRHFHEAWICTEGAYQEDACAVRNYNSVQRRCQGGERGTCPLFLAKRTGNLK